MSEERDERSAVSRRTMETVTAIGIFVVGAVLMWDSYRIGAGWGDDGPKSGYFPFYIGLILAAASVINLISAWREAAAESFVSTVKVRLVLAMLVPSVFYVGAIQLLGIYVASAIFIAAFMVWQGKYAVWKAALAGIGVSVVLFFMFEVWFKVPLPKGPIENMLGF